MYAHAAGTFDRQCSHPEWPLRARSILQRAMSGLAARVEKNGNAPRWRVCRPQILQLLARAHSYAYTEARRYVHAP